MAAQEDNSGSATTTGARGTAGGTVAEGDTIIWDVNGERQTVVTINHRARVKLGKSFFPADVIMGAPYGAMFGPAPDGQSLERIAYTPLSDWDLPSRGTGPDINTRSNAQLVDTGEAQALSAADIEELKAGGAAGAEIVAALTANSATFAAKTEFSQEKYRKKKAKKYIQVATVRRPTAAALCEALFAGSPARISYLRLDSLALLLNLANVGAHSRVLVVESCAGLVTGAVAERLGGHGGVVSAWPGGPGTRQPSLHLVRSLNMSEQQLSGVRCAPLHELLQEADGAQQRARQQQQQQQQQGAPGIEQPQQQQQGTTQENGAAAVAVDGTAEPMDVQQDAPAGHADAAGPAQQAQQDAAHASALVHPPQQEPRQPRQAKQSSPLLRPPFTSCILVTHGCSPLALIRRVLPLLAPSACLVVHSPWQGPLAEALDALRGSGQAVGLALQEAWWREMQVLPLRTHPTMNMNHGGGYILSMTTLAQQPQQ